MKKMLALMLILAALLGVCASAEATALNMPENIGENYNPYYIQRYGDTLYFVDMQQTDPDDYDSYIHTLYAMDASGSVTQIGESRKSAREYSFDDGYSYMTDATSYNGYGDMTVYADHIYFIGTDDTAGTYTTHSKYWNDGQDADFTSTYQGTACVYRMDLDGGNLVKLIPNLGNGEAHLAIANDRIAVSTCYMNNFFVYDFVNFMICDMDGNVIKTFENSADPTEYNGYMDDNQYQLIVQGILTDGEEIYASLSDSEGDFASSRLAKVSDINNELFLEAYFVNSVKADNGAIVYFTSAAQDVYWDDVMATTLTLRVYENGESRILAYIPEQYGEGWEQRLCVIGDMAYYINEDVLLRVSLSGGEVMRYENGAFVAAPECNPEYYNGSAGAVSIIGGADGPTAVFIAGKADEDFYLLPDSDTRKYDRSELEQYDTETLGLMRNEILARHGYPFKKEVYRSYFESKPWYTRNEKFEYNMLNEIEMANVETIKKIEASR